MPIQTSYGVEVDNDIFAAIDARFREGLSICNSRYRTCAQDCEQYDWYDQWSDCRERCSQASGHCQMSCWRFYERDIRRFGRPIGGANGNPGQALTRVKFACQIASDELGRGAKDFVITGYVLAETYDFWGGVLLGITGMLMDVQAWRLEGIAIDPPAEDYQDVFGPRDIAITDVIPAVPIGSSSLFSDVLPLIAPNIASGTLLEAMSVALDRAAYANEVDAEEPYFMQLRVSQGFANGGAWCLQQSQEQRLVVVDRLRMLTREQLVGRSAQDVEKDMRMQSMYARSARIAGESASQFRADGNDVVISYVDALQALDTMRRDGLPDWLRNAIMAVAIDDDTANTIMSRILSAELQQDNFDRPVADIFERVQFSTAENNLATDLRAWADFYRNGQ